ncbi:MAG: polyprenyl synthetase family protein [Mariprofundaceae bacterium]|nr:polyprenyl synthetase family protein [Mariprofundaceae bacterium]
MKNNPLQQAFTLCQAQMDELNQGIIAQLDSDVGMIPAIGHYIVKSGGKRMRPLLCMLTSRLFGHQGQNHIMLAMVIEFIHTASLLHDDVVDASDQRRGTPSVNHVWGNQASVLVGDFLFSRAFELSVESQDMAILGLLARVTNLLAEGEVLQLSRSFHLEMTEAQSLEVIERKTAVLFSAATEIGARISGQSEEVIQHMHEYGMCLGVAFQLIDDALDYSASSEAVGKPVGHDLEEGKITFPLIYAMQQHEPLQVLVSAITEHGSYQHDERHQVRSMVETHGGVDHCVAQAKVYANRAKEALEKIDHSDQKEVYQLMLNLADFAAQRPF